MSRVAAGWIVAPLPAFIFWGSWTIIAMPFIYLVVLGAGIPLFTFFASRHWLSWWHATSAGLVAGALPALVWFLASDPAEIEKAGSNPYALLPPTLAFPAYGASVGMLFWCIAILGNSKFTPKAANDA